MAIIIREAGRDTTTNMEIIDRCRRHMVQVLEIIGMETSLQVKNQIVLSIESLIIKE